MPKFFTCGCGILKGSHKHRAVEFQDRLRQIHKSIGKPLRIMDIRKYECGSRNGKAFAQGIYGIGCLINDIWPVAMYTTLSALSNTFGSTQAGLWKYFNNVRENQGAQDDDVKWEFDMLLNWIKTEDHAIVLLCGCRDAFKPNGYSWHCHRAPLSVALLKELGKDWRVEHL